jgi:hypothetical protein
MITLTNLLTLVNLLCLVGGLIGGYIVLRSSITKTKDEVQDRVRDALIAENALLNKRLDRMDIESKKQARVLALIITTMKKLYGIEIDIDEDAITLKSTNGNVSRVSTE